MTEIIDLIRKQGVVKVNTKGEADMIVQAAAKEGYNFEQQKEGWSFLVTDMDY